MFTSHVVIGTSHCLLNRTIRLQICYYTYVGGMWKFLRLLELFKNDQLSTPPCGRGQRLTLTVFMKC